MKVLGVINVLGTEYVISEQNSEENPKLKDNLGLCEQYSKEIVIDDCSDARNDIMCVENYQACMRKVLRHEIIHAFLGESGLRNNSDWAENEEMIDFFAIQIEKMVKAMIEARCFTIEEEILKEAGKLTACAGHASTLRPAT